MDGPKTSKNSSVRNIQSKLLVLFETAACPILEKNNFIGKLCSVLSY